MEPLTVGVALAASHLGQYLWDWCKAAAGSQFKKSARSAVKELLKRAGDPALPDSALLEQAALDALGQALQLMAASLAEQLEPRPTLADAIARQCSEGTWQTIPLFHRLDTPARRWVEGFASAARDTATLASSSVTPITESDVLLYFASGNATLIANRLAVGILDWTERHVQCGERPPEVDKWLRHGWRLSKHSQQYTTLFDAHRLFFRAACNADERLFRSFVFESAHATTSAILEIARQMPTSRQLEASFERQASRTGEALARISEPLELLAGHAPPALDELRYRQHLLTHYGRLDIAALHPHDPDHRDISLEQVFVPLLARDCGPWPGQNRSDRADVGQDTERVSPAHPKPDDRRTTLAELDAQRGAHEAPPCAVADLMERSGSPCRAVVLGAAGSGKSSFLRVRLIDWARTRRRPLPVFIELRRYHRSEHKDLLEYLANDIDLTFRFNVSELRDRLALGNAELLLDGLDEILAPAAREAMVRQIARYAGEYPLANIIVSSRMAGYPYSVLGVAGFSHSLLADFNREQIESFVARWQSVVLGRADVDHDLRAQLTELFDNQLLAELAGNPLLLTLMAVLRRDGGLPQDPNNLYERASNLLLEQWDGDRHLRTDIELRDTRIDLKDKQDLLEKLAWSMQNDPKTGQANVVSRSRIERLIDTVFRHRIPDPGRRRRATSLLIERLIGRSAILCHLGGQEFAFVHRGFLEYFASRSLRLTRSATVGSVSRVTEVFHAHVSDAAWCDVLTLAAAASCPRHADHLLRPLLRDARPEDVGQAQFEAAGHAFLVACRVLRASNHRNALSATAIEACASLRAWILDQPNSPYAGQWVTLLAATFRDVSTQSFLTSLARRTDDTRARRQAVASLAQFFPTPGTRALLTRIARRSEDTQTRARAVTSLAQVFRSEQTRALLVEVAQREDETSARARALDCLARTFPDERTRGLLRVVASGRRDTPARCQAIKALAVVFRDEQSRTLLLEIVRGVDDVDSMARMQAVESLAEFFPGEEIRALLVQLACGDDDSPARTGAILSLAEFFASEETRMLLMNLIRREEDTRARRQCVTSLVHAFPGRETESVIAKVAQSPNPTRARRQAAQLRWRSLSKRDVFQNRALSQE